MLEWQTQPPPSIPPESLAPPSIPSESLPLSSDSQHQLQINNYRQFHAVRIEYLQQMKSKLARSKSVNSLIPSSIDSQASQLNITPSAQNNNFSDKLSTLQRNMLSLMEKDVTLLGQLLSLSESVDQLKRSVELPLSPASSTQSLTDIEQDEVNHIRVGDSSSSSEDQSCSSSSPPPALYFSRKNSVLRIPIPPSHRSQRCKHRVSCEEEESSSGVSSSNSSSVGSVRQANRQRRLRLSIAPADFEESTSSRSSNSPLHQVQNSIDSGICGVIHLDVKKKQVEVHV